MNFDEQTYQTIENYLDGTLPEQEHKHFEDRMASDIFLAQEVAINQEMRIQYGNEISSNTTLPYDTTLVEKLKKHLKSEETKALSEKIKKGEQLYKSTKRQKPVIRLKYLYYAAAAVALVFLVNTLFINNNVTSQELYVAYKDWDALPSLTFKGENSKELAQGEALFHEKKYAEAISILDIYKNSKNPHVLIYLGVSYLELDVYDKAERIFIKITEMNTLDRSKGYWYLALTYLKQGDDKKVITALKKIRDDENNYKYEEAGKLLQELRDK
ncbi:hypothetical protein AB832_01480 [Flavobacteriaceae bacterium (ex Bugula neritina AB1)]|nr:hypothetical protein AB832_01480 [Flavobacteriaceae bacterium (ex Bugula neritina AB1)]